MFEIFSFFSCCRNSTLRKTMSFDHTKSEFSQQSVVFAMERFSRAVANMDETVMVPCKLMDVPVGSDPNLDAQVPRRSRAMIRDMQSADLHSLYTMLNSLKNELIWGSRSNTDNATAPSAVPSSNNSTINSSSSQQQRPNSSITMVRRPSVNSMTSMTSVTSSSASSSSSSSSTCSSSASSSSGTSTGSGTSSSSYSDSDSESGLMDHESTEDSGVEAEREQGEPDGDECVEQMANQFRRHLLGLHQCLEHMADAAHYLTHRYQVEIGSAD